VFGRFFERDGRYLLPFNLEVDHALMDGLHLAKFFKLVELEANTF
jgi:chloramphenicol O-acetyltransferase type A